MHFRHCLLIIDPDKPTLLTTLMAFLDIILRRHGLKSITGVFCFYPILSIHSGNATISQDLPDQISNLLTFLRFNQYLQLLMMLHNLWILCQNSRCHLAFRSFFGSLQNTQEILHPVFMPHINPDKFFLHLF